MPFDDDPHAPPPSSDEPTLRLWNLTRFGAHDPGTPRELAQAIADGADLNARNRFGITPLILAIKFDAPGNPATRALLAAGAPIGAKSAQGSALAFASRLLDNGQALRLLTEEQARRLALKERDALERAAEPAPPRPAPRV